MCLLSAGCLACYDQRRIVVGKCIFVITSTRSVAKYLPIDDQEHVRADESDKVLSLITDSSQSDLIS